MARKKPPAPPAPHPLAEADVIARAGLAATVARLPVQPSAAVLVLRLPDGLVAAPLGILGDVLAALTAAQEIVYRDGVARVSYGLTTPAPATPKG